MEGTGGAKQGEKGKEEGMAERVENSKKQTKRTNGKNDHPGGAASARKARLRSSLDLYNRLKWDNSLWPEGQMQEVFIGYEDRFEGMKEITLAEFEPDLQEDGGDIPFHRIWYFRTKDKRLWDRKTRYDAIFRSGDTELLEQDPEAALAAQPTEKQKSGRRSGTANRRRKSHADAGSGTPEKKKQNAQQLSRSYVAPQLHAAEEENYKAAGFLPLAFLPDETETLTESSSDAPAAGGRSQQLRLHLLAGLENRGIAEDQPSVFLLGGKREPHDRDVEMTALREFIEESGLVMESDRANLYFQMRTSSERQCYWYLAGKYALVLYAVNSAQGECCPSAQDTTLMQRLINLPTTFSLLKEKPSDCKMQALFWIPVEDLLAALIEQKKGAKQSPQKGHYELSIKGVKGADRTNNNNDSMLAFTLKISNFTAAMLCCTPLRLHLEAMIAAGDAAGTT
ncbi:MJ1316 domain-containing protein [Balamuthia mandrillaris]